MKKFFKVMAAVMLLPMILSTVSGCGKTGKAGGDSANKGTEMIYVPTERNITSDANHYNSDFTIKDGRLYYLI